MVTAPRHTRPIAPQMIWRLLFCCLNSGRAISMCLKIVQTFGQTSIAAMRLKIQAVLATSVFSEPARVFVRGIGCPLPDRENVHSASREVETETILGDYSRS